MATQPGVKKIRTAIGQTESLVREKSKEFKEAGKQFAYDSYGPGVVPEEEWTKFPREVQNG